ncbi:MAG: hypothetical protein NT166_19030 [Candidatus Aminicenantes bacterium]|nr:hypothetical protein [Candidatus Aminicenantes bacterium]
MLKKLTTKKAIEEKGELKERMAELGCNFDCRRECGRSAEVQYYAQLSLVY